MTFPTCTTGSGNSGGNTTSYVASLPDNLAVGDIVVLSAHKDGTGAITWPGSPAWTIVGSAASTGASFGDVRFRRIDGTEGWGGTGNSITLTGASEGWAHAWAKVVGAHSVTAVLGQPTTGSNSAPDAPAFNPADWDVEDTLWIDTYGWDGNVSNSAYPTAYPDNRTTSRWANTGGCGIAMATRNLAAASDDPGVAALSASEQWRAYTIAVRPAPPPLDPAIRQIVSNGINSGPISLSLTLAEVGDTVLFICADNWYTLANLLTPTGTAVTTWAEQTGTGIPVDGGTNDNHARVWLGTVTTAGGTAIANRTNNDDEGYAVAVVYVGAVEIDDLAGTETDTSSTAHVAPSVTPDSGAADDSLVCVWGTQGGGPIDYTVPGSMIADTERDVETFNTYRAATEKLTTDSATGTRTATASASEQWFAVSVLVKPASGTTPVDSDLDIRWQVLSRINSDLDARWQVLNRLNSDHDLRWQVLGRFNSDLDIRWQTLNRINSDHDLRWQVLNRLNSDHDIRWQVLNRLDSDLDIRWQVFSSLLSVDSDLDIRWQTLNRFDSDLDIRWQVLNRLNSDHDIRWQVLNSLSSDLDIRWQVLSSGLISIDSDLNIQWQVLNSLDSDLDIRWRILGPPTYRFFPPTTELGPVGMANSLLLKGLHPYPIALRLENGVYVETTILVYERDVLGKIDGVDYFVGGHRYSDISQAVADVLLASGYTPEVES